jgi:choline kinase
VKAIILAAGRGLRLKGVCGGNPKCLLEIGGRTLIERQVESLRTAGISEIVVVVGFKADRVRRACGPRIRFIENDRFAQTNSLYSLWLARDLLMDGFLVMNSDVLFHPALLPSLLQSVYADALLVSFHQIQMAALGDEEMKVRVDGERVVDISKSMLPDQAHGENVGIAKFGPDGARMLVGIMDRLVSAGGVCKWAPAAFRELCAERPLYAIATGERPWIEIDFPEDYHRAVTEVFPRITMADDTECESAA